MKLFPINILISLFVLSIIFQIKVSACSPGESGICPDGTTQWCNEQGNFVPECTPGQHGVSIGKSLITNEKTGTNITQLPYLNSVGGLISVILPNVFVVAGLIIFFFILLGGFTMVTNAGNVEKQKEGRQILFGAVLGFAIIFAAYWIIQLLGLILVGDTNAFLNPKGPNGLPI